VRNRIGGKKTNNVRGKFHRLDKQTNKKINGERFGRKNRRRWAGLQASWGEMRVQSLELERQETVYQKKEDHLEHKSVKKLQKQTKKSFREQSAICYILGHRRGKQMDDTG